MDEKIKNRGGQIAIWVILAIFLLASIILFFSIERKPEFIERDLADFNYETLLRGCVRDNVHAALNIMLPQGGLLEPKNFVSFDGDKVEYICENVGFYNPCVQQHPALQREMENDIYNYLNSKIEECYLDVQSKALERKAVVRLGSQRAGVRVKLTPDKVEVEVEKEVMITEKGQDKSAGNFKVSVESGAYELGKIAMEIAKQEADNCFFSDVGYGIIYPRYDIDFYELSGDNYGTTIYIIKDRQTMEEMKVAVRSCAFPIGI